MLLEKLLFVRSRSASRRPRMRRRRRRLRCPSPRRRRRRVLFRRVPKAPSWVAAVANAEKELSVIPRPHQSHLCSTLVNFVFSFRVTCD
ncbi:60S ribosomal protein L24, partial [Zea mays]